MSARPAPWDGIANDVPDPDAKHDARCGRDLPEDVDRELRTMDEVLFDLHPGDIADMWRSGLVDLGVDGDGKLWRTVTNRQLAVIIALSVDALASLLEDADARRHGEEPDDA